MTYNVTYCKGLERPRLIGLTGDGLNYAWTTKIASAPSVEQGQDDYIKETCSPRSHGLNHRRTQLDSAALLLYSHLKDISSLIELIYFVIAMTNPNVHLQPSVKCLMSHVMCHMSHARCQVSRVICPSKT